MDAGFGVYLLPAALPYERQVCFYSGCGDLASVQDTLVKVQRAEQLTIVADHAYWPL